jgi:PAS domain S-box-containing protein
MPSKPTRIRILIVEDETAHVEAISRSLEGMKGAELRVMNTLREFQDEAVAWNPDIALMGLNLPDGRATEVLANPLDSRTFPVIVMTSYGSEQTAVEAMKSGALDYLVKSPATFLGLPHTLERLLREWSLLAAHRRAQEALRESEARYRTQFDLGSEGICTLSPEGDLLEVNEAFARIHGYSREEMLKMHLGELDTPDSLKLSPERTRRILAGEALTFEVEHFHKDGHVFPMEVSASRVSSGGNFIMLCFHRDITERKREEEEKAKLQAQLQQSQKMESLGTLAGGVAHDMNNVLAAILGMAQLGIDEQPAGSQGYRSFDTIIRAATRGGKMIKSLLSFARQSPVESHELDINEILREEVRMLERTTLARVRLQLDLAGDLRLICGDEGALTHAFMNLCVNAVDAMPENGTLTLHTRNVGNGWIEVSVEDTGSGMPKEVLEKALDPFFTTKGVGKGTGLGLSMVYRTVVAHKGQIEIQSEPGQGTRVRMRFPVCAVAPLTAEPRPEVRSETPHGALSVLLVDDDELIQTTLQGFLKKMGHSVTAVISGEEALAKLEAGFQPEVVILDMNMPGLGGAGTLPRLRALYPTVPVLLATGRVDENATEVAAAYPFVTLLPKPFGMQELRQYLASLGR